jgi:hypothetical protein
MEKRAGAIEGIALADPRGGPGRNVEAKSGAFGGRHLPSQAAQGRFAPPRLNEPRFTSLAPHPNHAVSPVRRTTAVHGAYRPRSTPAPITRRWTRAAASSNDAVKSHRCDRPSFASLHHTLTSTARRRLAFSHCRIVHGKSTPGLGASNQPISASPLRGPVGPLQSPIRRRFPGCPSGDIDQRFAMSAPTDPPSSAPIRLAMHQICQINRDDLLPPSLNGRPSSDRLAQSG